MKMVRLIPSNRAIELFPKNPITGEPSLDMDPAEINMPLLVGLIFTVGDRSLVITSVKEQQFPEGDGYVLVGVDLA